MLDGYLLRYFLAVAEAGNFSRAAKAVSVTQPTLSAGIAKLERQIGARLFERDRHRVMLTPAGHRFLPRARRIAAEYEQAFHDLQAAPTPQVLRLGVLPTIPAALLEGVLARHAAARSGEVVEMVEGAERDLVERLDRGRLDAALAVLRPHHDRFAPEPLRSERYLMVLPEGHRLAGRPRVEAEDLAGDAMVLRRHCEALPEINRFFTSRGVRPRLVLKTTSDARAIAVVRAGAGIGMMPEGFADAGLRFVPVADFDLRREIGLLHTGGRRREDSAFLAHLREGYTR